MIFRPFNELPAIKSNFSKNRNKIDLSAIAAFELVDFIQMFTFNKLIDENGSFIIYRALTEASVLVRARNGNAVQAGAHTPHSELNENSAANVVFILSF